MPKFLIVGSKEEIPEEPGRWGPMLEKLLRQTGRGEDLEDYRYLMAAHFIREDDGCWIYDAFQIMPGSVAITAGSHHGGFTFQTGEVILGEFLTTIGLVAEEDLEKLARICRFAGHEAVTVSL